MTTIEQVESAVERLNNLFLKPTYPYDAPTKTWRVGSTMLWVSKGRWELRTVRGTDGWFTTHFFAYDGKEMLERVERFERWATEKLAGITGKAERRGAVSMILTRVLTDGEN